MRERRMNVARFETWRQEDQDHPQLQDKFKARLGYMRTYQREKERETEKKERNEGRKETPNNYGLFIPPPPTVSYLFFWAYRVQRDSCLSRFTLFAEPGNVYLRTLCSLGNLRQPLFHQLM